MESAVTRRPASCCGKEIPCNEQVNEVGLYWSHGYEFWLYTSNLRPHCFVVAIATIDFGFLLHVNNPTLAHDDPKSYQSYLEGPLRNFRQWWPTMHHGRDMNPKLYSVLPQAADHDGQLQAARWFVDQVKITTGLSSRGIMFASPPGHSGASVEIKSHGDWGLLRRPEVYVNGIYCDPPT
jgi:hypothetical protein